MQAKIVGGGGRREIEVICPDCNHPSLLPPSAVVRNQFFCSRCGIPLDLSQLFRTLAVGAPAQTSGRDQSGPRYKSARKGRR